MGLLCVRRVPSLKGWAFCANYFCFYKIKNRSLSNDMRVRKSVQKLLLNRMLKLRFRLSENWHVPISYHMPGLGTQESLFLSLLISHSHHSLDCSDHIPVCVCIVFSYGEDIFFVQGTCWFCHSDIYSFSICWASAIFRFWKDKNEKELVPAIQLIMSW